MASVTETRVTDDLDGSTDDVLTCYLALGETAIEIDLSAEHRTELEEFLAPYIEAGRPIRSEKPTRRHKQAMPGGNRERTQMIRQWAEEQGLTVSQRGRISKEVQAAYDAAH